MITIGINGNEANVSHRVGSGQYAYELLKHLALLASKESHFKIYLESDPMPDFPKETDYWHYQIIPHQKLWTLTALQKTLVKEAKNKTAPDVFFTPSHYTPLFMPIPSVVAIMDLSFERFPSYFKKKDYYQLKYWSWVSAKAAKHILTISEFSKSEIEAIYKFPSSKITVTYPGFDEERFNSQVPKEKMKIASTLQKYKIDSPYVLFLGTLQPRKNLVRLIEAFAELPDKKLKLVIVGMINEGRGGWMNTPIFDKVKSLGINDRVIFTGYVPDGETPYLFAGAKCYVLPSLYEGFGIPPVESMAIGTPVVVSQVSSLPEICGQAAEYIEDPYSVSSITSSLNKLLNWSEAERKKRVALGQKYVNRYNWMKTAEQTLQVLKKSV